MDVARLREDVAALHDRLEAAQAASALPDTPGGHDALHGLVVRARLGAAQG
ncbi:nucleotidyltransferase [Streptomyces paromomycinus]|uniref:Nucleotidyltransferase n=1 Tax=Streptomyces paromomycinus TaxID=92743 RepID=A0A401WC36_STREY|nr:nucleotidyltransferase [Streptomyces paromomycinus]